MIHAVKVHDLVSGKAEAPGENVLVDRMWPRGIAKKDLDATWLKEVAPSPDLRKWFDHDPDKFDEFAKRYKSELDSLDNEDMETLRKFAEKGAVSLLYAAKDSEINHAVVLKEWLEK